MVTGEIRFAAVFELFVAEEFGDGERPDVDLVEAFLHGGVVNLVGGIGEMAGVAGGAAEHRGVGDRADLALGVDGVGADEKLLGLGVDETIRGGAADTLGVDRLPKSGVDRVEFVVGALGRVRGIGDDPEFVGPRNDGAGAALALGVKHREVRVDAAEGKRRFGGKGRRGDGEEQGTERRSHQ